MGAVICLNVAVKVRSLPPVGGAGEFGTEVDTWFIISDGLICHLTFVNTEVFSIG